MLVYSYVGYIGQIFNSGANENDLFKWGILFLNQCTMNTV